MTVDDYNPDDYDWLQAATECAEYTYLLNQDYYDKVQEQEKEWNRKGQANYRQNHPDKVATRNANRRGRIAGMPDTFTHQKWQRARDYFQGCCAVCGNPQGLWHKIVMDHWIPISAPNCPGTVETNIVPLCHAMADGIGCCNNLKNNKEPLLWLIERYGERKGKRINKKIQAYFASVA